MLFAPTIIKISVAIDRVELRGGGGGGGDLPFPLDFHMLQFLAIFKYIKAKKSPCPKPSPVA